MAQIKKDTSLRKAILQAAITGQLISDIGGESLPLAAASKPSSATPSPRGYAPKTPNEFASFENQNSVSERSERPTLPETGKQLLDRIIEERKNKLLADWEEKQTDLFASNDAHSKNAKTVRSEQIRLLKKAKKPSPIVASEIDEDEIPFEIPENWCWCRLEDLVTILGDGLHGTPQYDISGEYYFVNGNNLNNGVIEIKPDTKKINEKEFEKYKKDLNETTIFVSINGTIGNIAFYNNEKIILGKSACYFNVAIEDLKKYFFYLFQTDFFLNYALDNATGTTIKNVGLGTMRNFLLPLPPLSVQNAIVAKLEQVLPLVDAYENALLQKEELKSALPDKVKKAILQEAITGKLTENWRKSATIKESGKQLLDRIIEERNAKALADWKEALKKNVGGKATLPSFASKTRTKKPVPVVASEIEEDEIPFEVPESWCWCHLGEICNEIKRGKSPKYVDRSDYLAFAQKCNVKTGGIDLSLALYLDEKSIDRYSEEDNLIKGDVVINSTGGGTMGRVGYYETKVPEGIKGVYPDSHVTVIRSVGNINQRYLYYILKHNQPVLEDCGTGSTNQTELKPAVLANFVIPLPPLEEQEEIVKKVEELLLLCK